MLYEVVLTFEPLDKIIKFKQFKYPNSACDPVEGDSGIFSCKNLYKLFQTITFVHQLLHSYWQTYWEGKSSLSVSQKYVTTCF